MQCTAIVTLSFQSASLCIGSSSKVEPKEVKVNLTDVDILPRDTSFVTTDEISTWMKDREIWGHFSRDNIGRGHEDRRRRIKVMLEAKNALFRYV